MLKAVFSLCLALVIFSGAAPAAAFDHEHSKWNELTGKFVVVNGPASTVRYRELKANDQLLKAYLTEVQAVTDNEYQAFSDSQQKAFLINAYNAYTVRLILDHYPLESIKDLGGFFSSPWQQKDFKLFGENISLDHIEHVLARGKFNEPRFHFAFVCASTGCPQIKNEAWISKKLEAQFDDAASKYLSDQSRNRFDEKTRVLELSRIFRWYREDFEKNGSSIEEFVANHMPLPPAQLELIRAKKVKLSFLPYNWNLNEAK